MDDVPPAEQVVKLAQTGNMSTGGISIDRTLDAHPDNVEIAEEAARLIGLDVAGIDFICPDITEPVRETGGAICEVNAAPGFRMHTHPTIGDPQFIAKPVVDSLFPPGAPSRVPIIAVTGTNGKTTTSRMIAHIFKGLGRKVGHDLHRRRRHRRTARDQGRRVGAEERPDGAAEPPRRHGGVRGRPRRHPARGPRVRPQRRRGRHERRGRPPRHARHRHRRTARGGQARDRRGGAAQRFCRPERRRPARSRDAPPLLGRGGLVLARRSGLRGARADRPALPPWRQGAGPRTHRPRRDDRDPARTPLHAARLDAPAAGDVRRVPRGSTSRTRWLRRAPRSPPARRCTTSGRACAPSAPATACPPAA